MRNCIILGSGRSGTSLTAGLFAKSGYYMGDELLAARDANPKGFFESQEINNLNEEIIQLVTPQRIRFRRWSFPRSRPTDFQRWLSRIPLDTKMKTTPAIDKKIKEKVLQEPFCFKDPRFSYTLPVWIPLLKNTVFIVVFRHPYSTMVSIEKECNNELYLKNLKISRDDIFEVWSLMYKHILRSYQNDQQTNKWLFIHYEQILDKTALTLLYKLTSAKIDSGFIESKLYRNKVEYQVPHSCQSTYDELCELNRNSIIDHFAK